MSTYRVYYDEETTLEGSIITLSHRESHHLLKVRRARDGERVDVFDGKGVVIETTLKKRSKQARLQVGSREKQARPTTNLTLAVSMLKSKAMDLLVRQATEMGVAVIQPLVTKYSEVRIDKHQFQEKKERWNTIALEACKQSGNPYLPEMREPCELNKWLSRCRDDRHYWVASLQKGAVAIVKNKVEGNAHCVLIGPEGDFNEQEYEAINRAGFTSLSLGRYVLRSETAVVRALSVILSMADVKQ